MTTTAKNTTGATRKIKLLAARILKAKAQQDKLKGDVERWKDALLSEAPAGLGLIETSLGSLQIIRPVSAVVDDKVLDLLAKNHPDLLDEIAPAVRKVDVKKLRAAIDAGKLPARWSKHITHKAGTTQLRAAK